MCPDMPVAVVQYTFTHKHYTEQNNETEYNEKNIHNNKNTWIFDSVYSLVAVHVSKRDVILYRKVV
jgi:hypothetical protein